MLITTPEYKAWRGIASTDYDATIGVLIGAAQSYIETETGRTPGGFESANGPFTETLDGDGTQLVKVSNGPITSITSIKVGNESPTTLSADSYSFRDRTIVRLPRHRGSTIRQGDEWFNEDRAFLHRSPAFPFGYDNIEVVYTAGYASGEIPDALKLVAYRVMDHLMDSRGRDYEVSSEAIGGANVSMRNAQDLQARIRDLLRPWRDPL